MRLKRIQIENDPILGKLTLDFTNNKGESADTVVLAGENGVGKSMILDLISDFSNFRVANDKPRDLIKKITIELSEEEIGLLASEIPGFKNGIDNNEMVFVYDYKVTNNWSQVKLFYKDSEGNQQETHGGVIANNNNLNDFFRSIYSSVEINFTPKPINSVTASDIDQKQPGLVKSSPNLATEITQLLIDVQALDDSEISKWTRANVGEKVPKEVLNNRMKRFTDAFSFMFPHKKYKEIRNEGNKKLVIFEEHGKEMSIDKLSSGEKQIIFRGGFLLKDKKSIDSAVVLIDEPEISLHPRWQQKILSFYKKLFSDDSGHQTSQIFIATHSPFIIHNEEIGNNKVIILEKDEAGMIQTPEVETYYGWTSGEVVAKAFNIDLSDELKPLILTEGKTDAQLIRVAWNKLYNEEIPYEVVSVGVEEEESERSGSADLVKRTLELVTNITGQRKVLGVFDNDREGYSQFKGFNKHFEVTDDLVKKHTNKNIYGMLLPPPDFRSGFVTDIQDHRYFAIEHYFTDTLLQNNNLKGDNVLSTEIFLISGSKNTFSQKAVTFEAEEFINFESLFSQIKSILED